MGLVHYIHNRVLDMATVQSATTSETAEAVIISGPKRGAIVRIRDDNLVLSDDYVLTPEEDRAFDDMQAQADRTLESLRAASQEAHGLLDLDDVRSLRRELQHGIP